MNSRQPHSTAAAVCCLPLESPVACSPCNTPTVGALKHLKPNVKTLCSSQTYQQGAEPHLYFIVRCPCRMALLYL